MFYNSVIFNAANIYQQRIVFADQITENTGLDLDVGGAQTPNICNH